MIKKEKTLKNGVKIPTIGFGTYLIEDGKDTSESVRIAINSGYRLIDTAAIYQNEKGVGLGIKKSGVDRKDIFLTSKLWNTEQGYDSTLRAFDASLKKLGTDYLDLYLIHWPVAGHGKEYQKYNLETWRAFEELYGDGRVRAIGVSNFLVHHLKPLMNRVQIKPMVNQLELNPQYQQPEIVELCREHKIAIEAWGPMMQGRVFGSDGILSEVAKKYKKTVAQICIRWSLQRGFIPLPKSSNPERIAANLDVFDFNISDDDMYEINSLRGSGFSGLNPDLVTF